ncbi:uncharacterized protein LOC143018728 [Oratosquilla oratoria]|uniref:uncharacterized protein LOC143018728 n=1 Tax=Oratosquilla oratoria TaxID=337810 RepID=UPI003F7766D1
MAGFQPASLLWFLATILLVAKVPLEVGTSADQNPVVRFLVFRKSHISGEIYDCPGGTGDESQLAGSESQGDGGVSGDTKYSEPFGENIGDGTRGALDIPSRSEDAKNRSVGLEEEEEEAKVTVTPNGGVEELEQKGTEQEKNMEMREEGDLGGRTHVAGNKPGEAKAEEEEEQEEKEQEEQEENLGVTKKEEERENEKKEEEEDKCFPVGRMMTLEGRLLEVPSELRNFFIKEAEAAWEEEVEGEVEFPREGEEAHDARGAPGKERNASSSLLPGRLDATPEEASRERATTNTQDKNKKGEEKVKETHEITNNGNKVKKTETKRRGKEKKEEEDNANKYILATSFKMQVPLSTPLLHERADTSRARKDRRVNLDVNEPQGRRDKETPGNIREGSSEGNLMDLFDMDFTLVSATVRVPCWWKSSGKVTLVLMDGQVLYDEDQLGINNLEDEKYWEGSDLDKELYITYFNKNDRFSSKIGSFADSILGRMWANPVALVSPSEVVLDVAPSASEEYRNNTIQKEHKIGQAFGSPSRERFSSAENERTSRRSREASKSKEKRPQTTHDQHRPTTEVDVVSLETQNRRRRRKRRRRSCEVSHSEELGNDGNQCSSSTSLPRRPSRSAPSRPENERKTKVFPPLEAFTGKHIMTSASKGTSSSSSRSKSNSTLDEEFPFGSLFYYFSSTSSFAKGVTFPPSCNYNDAEKVSRVHCWNIEEPPLVGVATFDISELQCPGHHLADTVISNTGELNSSRVEISDFDGVYNEFDDFLPSSETNFQKELERSKDFNPGDRQYPNTLGSEKRRKKSSKVEEYADFDATSLVEEWLARRSPWRRRQFDLTFLAMTPHQLPVLPRPQQLPPSGNTHLVPGRTGRQSVWVADLPGQVTNLAVSPSSSAPKASALPTSSSRGSKAPLRTMTLKSPQRDSKDEVKSMLRAAPLQLHLKYFLEDSCALADDGTRCDKSSPSCPCRIHPRCTLICDGEDRWQVALCGAKHAVTSLDTSIELRASLPGHATSVCQRALCLRTPPNHLPGPQSCDFVGVSP